MNILALLFAVVAIFVFAWEALRTRSLIAAGLALVTLAWVLQLIVETTDPVTV